MKRRRPKGPQETKLSSQAFSLRWESLLGQSALLPTKLRHTCVLLVFLTRLRMAGLRARQKGEYVPRLSVASAAPEGSLPMATLFDSKPSQILTCWPLHAAAVDATWPRYCSRLTIHCQVPPEHIWFANQDPRTAGCSKPSNLHFDPAYVRGAHVLHQSIP